MGVPFYVGKGSEDRYRICSHMHENCTNTFLKNKIRKVGATHVKVHFLHKNLTEEEAFYWEKYWIKYIGRRDKKEGTLCNLTDGGEMGPIGCIVSEETRQKISETLKGNIPWNKGISCPEELKRKISDTLKGRAPSEEARRKISETLKGENHPMFGKPRSDETKRKISAALKNRPSPLKGGKLSEEHKQKIRKAYHKRWKENKRDSR